MPPTAVRLLRHSALQSWDPWRPDAEAHDGARECSLLSVGQVFPRRARRVARDPNVTANRESAGNGTLARQSDFEASTNAVLSAALSERVRHSRRRHDPRLTSTGSIRSLTGFVAG